MITTKRLGFTAKETCDFITKLRAKCEQNGYGCLKKISDIVAVSIFFIFSNFLIN